MKKETLFERFEKFSCHRMGSNAKCIVEPGRYCIPFFTDPTRRACEEAAQNKGKADE